MFEIFQHAKNRIKYGKREIFHKDSENCIQSFPLIHVENYKSPNVEISRFVKLSQTCQHDLSTDLHFYFFIVLFDFVKRQRNSVKHLESEHFMATERIYRTDQYKKSNHSSVTEVKTRNGFDIVACRESVFYPEGGGQPSDVGTITLGDAVYSVESAHDDGLFGTVWHYTNAPEGTFHAGDEVTLSIDWDIRFSHMQRHCGEHMLSGTMYNLFGGTNAGFHMGSDFITIDIDMGGRMLTGEEIILAEQKTNEAIRSGLPVTVTWFDDFESSLVMPVRKAVPHEGKVSVVTVGDVSDPYDCIACCGTHPASSYEVGLVSIYKHEPYKGMNRIYFDCGSKALDKLLRDSRTLTGIANKYSCGPQDLPARLASDEEKTSALKERLAALSAYVKDHELSLIQSELSGCGDPVYTYTSDVLSVDELLKLGFAAVNQTEGKLLLFMHPASHTVLLFSSGEAKCGQLVRKLAPELGGKGGGRDDNARALFADKAGMERFASELKNML